MCKQKNNRLYKLREQNGKNKLSVHVDRKQTKEYLTQPMYTHIQHNPPNKACLKMFTRLL